MTSATTYGTIEMVQMQQTYSIALRATGIWASAQTVTATFKKIGDVVTVSFDEVFATANTGTVITIDLTNVPAQFLPVVKSTASSLTGVALGKDNAASVQIGYEIFDSGDGVPYLELGVSVSGGVFAGSGNSGFNTFYTTYFTDYAVS